MMRVRLPLLAALLCVGLLASVVAPAGALSGTVYVTAQRFEHGQMIWWSDSSVIWVLFDSGRAILYPPGAYQRWPDNPYLSPPPGYVRPIFGFGKIWGNDANVRAGLGWATRPEIGYTAERREDPGKNYLRQLDDRWIEVASGTTWSYVDDLPPVEPAVITFTANPNPAQPGQTVTLSWQATGTELVQIGLFDTASGSQEPFSLLDDLPLTGSAPITLPLHMPGGVTAVAWAANHIPGAPPADKSQYAQLALIIGVDSSQSGVLTPRATYQPFERGFMVWREDTSAILVFWGGAGGGQWTTVPATHYSPLPDNPIFDIPPHYVRPIMGFGRVWGNNQYIRDLVGFATGHEVGYVTRIELQNGYPVAVQLPDGRVAKLNRNYWSF